MQILNDVYWQLLDGCPPVPPETGGILGGRNQVISHAFFDRNTLVTDRAQYIPNTDFLNHIITEWAKSGIEFYGLFHSHPFWETALSQEDQFYIKEIMRTMPDKQKYWFPVVIPHKEIIAFSAFRIGTQIQIQNDSLFCKK